MALVIDILQSFVIARPRVEIDRGMRPQHGSHLGPIATNSYDPEIARSGMTVALPPQHTRQFGQCQGFRSVGETGASCYNFHANSIFHKPMQARDFLDVIL